MAETDTMLDPICDMTVDPAKYLAPATARQSSKLSAPVPHQQRTRDLEYKPAIEGAIYTCPMDPEVRQQRGGACPKCGMALEPLDIGAPLIKT